MRAFLVTAVLLWTASASALPTPSVPCRASPGGTYSITSSSPYGHSLRGQSVSVFSGSTCSGSPVFATSLQATTVAVTDGGVVVGIRSRVASGRSSTRPIITALSPTGRASLSLDDLAATAALEGSLRVSVEPTGVRFVSRGGDRGRGLDVTVSYADIEAVVP
jgi:hypothetical protein